MCNTETTEIRVKSNLLPPVGTVLFSCECGKVYWKVAHHPNFRIDYIEVATYPRTRIEPTSDGSFVRRVWCTWCGVSSVEPNILELF